MPDGGIPSQSFPYRYHSQHSVPPADDIFCRRCGVIGEYRQTPGSGLHHASLTCSACGAFIRWVGKPRPPRRPTDKQIAFLHALGHEGAIPETRQEASERIGELLKAKGACYV